jgi:hypothetical protein
MSDMIRATPTCVPSETSPAAFMTKVMLAISPFHATLSVDEVMSNPDTVTTAVSVEPTRRETGPLIPRTDATPPRVAYSQTSLLNAAA